MDERRDNSNDAATVLPDSLFRKLVDQMVDGVLVLDPQGIVVYSNQRAEAIFGFSRSPSALPPVKLVDAVDPGEQRARVSSILNELVKRPGGSADWMPLEVQAARSDGAVFWVDLRIGRIAFDDRIWLVAVARDIDHQKRNAVALARAATTDELSGLANRRAFQRALEQHADQPIVVAFVDVDHFKLINDRYGHLDGDQALRFVADRLAKALPDAICVARLGGDEFGVILKPEPDVRSVVDRLDEIRKQIATIPFRADGATLTFSIGVAAAEPDAHSPRTLLTRADQALYQAKTMGRNRTCTWGN